MDWGNAIVHSKETGPNSDITSLTMDLHLEGDFRKTKKKITWLAQATGEHPPVEIRLLDYDYLLTKKKLEEEDDVKDFVTPVSEFREDALADANVTTLQKGDVIQFERKGYFIFDGAAVDGRLEFIKIPDGRAANLASKAGKSAVTGGAPVLPPDGIPSSIEHSEHQPASKMYRIANLYGEEDVSLVPSTKMYTVRSVYE